MMGIPTLITISGTVRRAGSPVPGRLVFTSPSVVREMAGADLYIPDEIVAVAGDDGIISVQVPATTDPDFTPTGWTWNVQPHFPGWKTPFEVAIPHDASGGTLTLAELVPTPASGGAELYALLVHTHAIADIDDLQIQLDGKQPVGTYLVADDIANLVSYETLGEELAAYLAKLNPEIVDTTFTVKKSDNTAALRFRSTGGAVDVDKSSGDVVISSFAGAGGDLFGGAQTPIARLRGNGLTFAGLVEFGGTVYEAQQWINSGVQLARLGGKAGGPVIVAGYKATPGAPSAGTWDADTLVQATDGLYRCSAGGTPGTWENLTSYVVRPGRMRTGSRYAPIFTTFAPATIALNEIRHVPIDFHSSCTITELAVEATAAVASAKVRILVSRADANGRPSGAYLYVSGQLDAAAIGKVGTGAISVSIPAPGRYFFAALPQGVLPTLRSIAQVPAMYEQVSMATYNRCCYSEYGVTGVPVNVGAVSIDAGDAPRVECLIG